MKNRSFFYLGIIVFRVEFMINEGFVKIFLYVLNCGEIDKGYIF